MNHQALKQEIHTADQAINNNDFDAVAKFYTADATLVVRPDLMAYGRSDIKEEHKRISEDFNDSLEVTQEDMVIIEECNIASVNGLGFMRSSKFEGKCFGNNY